MPLFCRKLPKNKNWAGPDRVSHRGRGRPRQRMSDHVHSVGLDVEVCTQPDAEDVVVHHQFTGVGVRPGQQTSLESCAEPRFVGFDIVDERHQRDMTTQSAERNRINVVIQMVLAADIESSAADQRFSGLGSAKVNAGPIRCSPQQRRAHGHPIRLGQIPDHLVGPGACHRPAELTLERLDHHCVARPDSGDDQRTRSRAIAVGPVPMQFHGRRGAGPVTAQCCLIQSCSSRRHAATSCGSSSAISSVARTSEWVPGRTSSGRVSEATRSGT